MRTAILALAPLLLSGCTPFAPQYNQGAASLAALSQVQTVTVETVGPENMPPLAGSGWHCYDLRITKASSSSSRAVTKTERPCHRTLADCQKNADAVATVNRSSGAETNVSPCAPHPTADCTYLWFSDGSGRHTCSADIDDCKGRMVLVSGTVPGIARPVRQTECHEVK